MVCQVVKLRSETNAWRPRLASMFMQSHRSMVALVFADSGAAKVWKCLLVRAKNNVLANLLQLRLSSIV